MKECKGCDVMIPDHAHRCPHCRHQHRQRDWQLQALLVASAAAAAVAVLAEACLP